MRLLQVLIPKVNLPHIGLPKTNPTDEDSRQVRLRQVGLLPGRYPINETPTVGLTDEAPKGGAQPPGIEQSLSQLNVRTNRAGTNEAIF